MGIFDNFGGKKTVPVDNTQQQNTNQQNTNQQPPNPGMTTGVDNVDNPKTTEKPKNPLDVYNNLFDNDASDKTKAPVYSIPDDKLKEVADTLDFTNGIDPELMTKATSGDANAMIQLMNVVGRGAYSVAMQHSSKLTDQYTNSRLEHENTSFGSRIKSELTKTEFSDIPGYDHPLVKQSLEQFGQLILTKNPDATPKEIARLTREYFTEVSKAMNPAKDTDASGNPTTAPAVDWDNWLERKLAA